MGINIKSILNYAKTCGVNNILQSNTPCLKKSNLTGSKIIALSADSFEHLNSNFCKMSGAENALIPEILHNTKMGKAFAEKIPQIRNLNSEKGFIFKECGHLAVQTNSNSSFNGSISKQDYNKIISLAQSKIKTGMIHNHPVKVTLSSTDLNTFLLFDNHIMMATTPKGGYSAIYKTKPVSKVIEDFRVAQDLRYILNSESELLVKLYRQKLSNWEIIRIKDDFLDKQLKRFTVKHEKYGLKYEYKPENVSEFKSEEDTFDIINMYNEQQLKGYLTDMGASPKQIDLYFKTIDETPIEDFLIPL